jgi:hypothetical protein
MRHFFTTARNLIQSTSSSLRGGFCFAADLSSCLSDQDFTISS